MDGLIESTLAEVCSLVTDGTHDTPRRVQNGFPLIKAKEIVGGTIDFETCDQISEEEHLRVIARSKPECGDTLFAHIGASLGEAAYVNMSREFSIKNIALFKPNPAIIDGRYLYYLVISPNFQALAKGTKTGSAQPFLSLNHLRNHPIQFHRDLHVQRRIAGILSPYDDLIENNTRRIKILEEMARAIYREWFVHFRFPGHEKVKLVDSPSGKTPAGWNVLTLGDVLQEIESGSRPKGGIDAEERGIPSIGAENVFGLGQYDYSKEKFVSQRFYESMRRGHVQNRDVLLYKDGAQIGRKTIFGDGFPHETCCINEHVFALRTNDRCTQAYLFFWLDQPDMTQAICNLNANAAQPGLNQMSVKGLPIILPPKPILDEFDKPANQALGLIFNLAKKTNVLRGTRDLLLPKLISGEIEVEGKRISVEAGLP